MHGLLRKTTLLLLSVGLISGCASRALIVDTHGLKDEAVLFDTIMLDPNHLHGVYVKSIDGLNPYSEKTPFRRYYQDTSRNSLAWVLPAGTHKLNLIFHESATILGGTAKSNTTVMLEMAAQGVYSPLTEIAGDEVEWRILDKRSGSLIAGPWRTPLERGFVFIINPQINPDVY